MNWIAVDNGVFVSILGQEFIYRNERTKEETCYSFDVLDGVSTAIGTRKKEGTTDRIILSAIREWMPFKYLEERVKLDYKQASKSLSQAWNDDAKFVMSMAISLVVPYRLRGVEIAEYLSNKDWDGIVNQWRHTGEYHKKLSKNEDYLTTFLNAQNKILSALLWLQKNRRLIECVVNYEKDTDSFYYEVLLGLPVSKIRNVAMEQITKKREMKLI